MQTKTKVFRAVSSVVAKRAIRFGVIIGCVIATALLLLIWALAHFVSGFFWLLLILWIPAVVSFALVVILARFISSKIYRPTLTPLQYKKITLFIDKIKRVAEQRGLSWQILLLQNLRDLLFYRELRTIRSITDDITTLRSDLAELETLFR